MMIIGREFGGRKFLQPKSLIAQFIPDVLTVTHGIVPTGLVLHFA